MAAEEVSGTQVSARSQPSLWTQATERAERIRSHLADAAQDYAAAIIEQDWKVLGYGSIGEWREAMFAGHRLAVETRRQVAELLSGQGMSTKEIAGATGTAQRTVQDDLSPGVSQDGQGTHYGASPDDRSTRRTCATPADQGRPSRTVTKVRTSEVPPKSPAERQAAHRQRQRVEPSVKTTEDMPPASFVRAQAEALADRQAIAKTAEVRSLKGEVAWRDRRIAELQKVLAQAGLGQPGECEAKGHEGAVGLSAAYPARAVHPGGEDEVKPWTGLVCGPCFERQSGESAWSWSRPVAVEATADR